MTRTVDDMSLRTGHMSDFYNPSLKKCQKHQRLFKHGEDTTLLKSDAGNRQIPPTPNFDSSYLDSQHLPL